MRIRITQLEMMKVSQMSVSQVELPCLVVNLSRDQTLIETHSSDLLQLCKDFKKTIIDGIREDFKEINHDMSDNYEKSMIIREHLNKKDAFIKRIDDLIKL